jgi:ATP/maltotriose-dependent transcriptional regulator MalT
MSMAELLLAQNRPDEAEKLLREALDVFRRESSNDDEVVAAGLLARALLNQGKTPEARNMVAAARAKARKIENPYARLNFLIEAARVDALSGKLAEGRSTIEFSLKNATELGFLSTQLNARLAFGEIERKNGDAATARARLAVLEQDANAHGFVLIARQALSLQNN